MNTSHQSLRILNYSKTLFVSMVGLVAVTYLALPARLHASPNSGRPLRPAIARPVLDHKADAKDVVDKLVAGDYEGIRKNFNAQMKAGLSADKMKEVWTATVNQLGKYKSQGQPHSGPGQSGWEIVVIRCQMEKGELDVEVDYDPDGLIGGLWLHPLS